MSDPGKESSKLKPVTFKIPAYMQDQIDRILEDDIFDNKAVLIREAIQDLIDYELKLPSVGE